MLLRCLSCLGSASQGLPADSFEILVTDDAPDAQTRATILRDFPEVKYLDGPRRGPAANRNNGAMHAKGEWLVFTDDDCIPQASWLLAFSDAIREFPSANALEGCIEPDDWKLLKNDLAECPVNTEGGCFWSANVAIRADYFRRIGGFNEEFPYAANEDQEIYDRILKAGAVPFIAAAKVIHPVRNVSLARKIKKAPALAQSWVKLQVTRQRTLAEIMKDACWNGLRYMMHDLSKAQFRKLLLHLYQFIFLMPRIPAWYRQQKEVDR
jgi:GT2 family glycosyltransferase